MVLPDASVMMVLSTQPAGACQPETLSSRYSKWTRRRRFRLSMKATHQRTLNRISRDRLERRKKLQHRMWVESELKRCPRPDRKFVRQRPVQHSGGDRKPLDVPKR